MKLRCLYIIMSLASLLFLTNCRDEEVVRSSEGKRTITVNLGIAMSRVNLDDTDLGEGTPSDMKVWIFEHDTNNRLAYLPEDNPVFSGSDALGGLVNTKEYVVEVESSIQALDFYVVLNSGNGTDLDLDENSDPSEIKEATFTGISTGLEDNQVPAYGSLEGFDVSEHKNTYTVPSIELTRAVGKLELFFTKENANSHLTINGITLEHVPDKGYLAPPASYDELQYNGEPIDLFSSPTSIDAVLTTDRAATTGNFSEIYEQDNTTFQRLELTQDYLLENPNGDTWTPIDANTDYVYPEDSEIKDKESRYKMTVNYTLGSNPAVDQVVYLPKIERNVWNKIFVRVKDKGELQIRYKAMPWEVVDSSIGYAPKPMTENPFSDKDDYAEFINNGESRYILLPLEKYRVERNDDGSIKYDYSNTQKLFNHLYENPEVGDNEARLCIITRPTYNDKIDKNQHWALKTGSAGARYYFMLTGPEGATWTAHLTNYDDFGFSNSETDDFAANTDDYGNDDVRMVTHGIARDKPYIIQIIAKNLYTGYQPAMSGETTEKGFNEDGYDQFKTKTKDEWKTYFGDDYLTGWGQAKWNAEEVVDTYFYITVKLKDGQDYVLKINPSYEDTEYDINAGANDFPFQKKHRYAGTDTHIWIRQIRAQHGIEFLEELAENESGIWWKDNQYWNPNHTWGNK